MTTNWIGEFLDVRILAVVEELKKQPMAPVERAMLSGTIAGFLIKTGIAIAVRGKCPRNVLEKACRDAVTAAYAGTN